MEAGFSRNEAGRSTGQSSAGLSKKRVKRRACGYGRSHGSWRRGTSTRVLEPGRHGRGGREVGNTRNDQRQQARATGARRGNSVQAGRDRGSGHGYNCSQAELSGLGQQPARRTARGDRMMVLHAGRILFAAHVNLEGFGWECSCSISTRLDRGAF